MDKKEKGRGVREATEPTIGGICSACPRPAADEGCVDFSAGWIVSAMLVSTVGFAIFLYGKKQTRFPQLAAGLALMIFPGFVASTAWMWSIAAVILGGLFLASRAGL